MDFIRVFIDENRDRQWLFFGENTVKNTFLCYYRKKIKKKSQLKSLIFNELKPMAKMSKFLAKMSKSKRNVRFNFVM